MVMRDKILLCLVGDSVSKIEKTLQEFLIYTNRQLFGLGIDVIVSTPLDMVIDIPEQYGINASCVVEYSGEMDYGYKCLMHMRIEKMQMEEDGIYTYCFYVDSRKFQSISSVLRFREPSKGTVATIGNHMTYFKQRDDWCIHVDDYFWYCRTVEFNVMASYHKYSMIEDTRVLFESRHFYDSKLEHSGDGRIGNDMILGYSVYHFIKLMRFNNLAVGEKKYDINAHKSV